MPAADPWTDSLPAGAKQDTAHRNAQDEHNAIILRRHRVIFVDCQILDLKQPRFKCAYHDRLSLQRAASTRC